MRLYKITGYPRAHPEFARYIIKEGGAKGDNVIEDAFQNKDPASIGFPYANA